MPTYILLIHIGRASFVASLGLLGTIALGGGCRPDAAPAPAVAKTTLVARDPLELPAPITRRSPTTVQVELRAIETVADLGDGGATRVWTFGGTVPGPMVRVMEGDDVVVRFENDATSAEPHSVDFHAVVGPGGGHAVTEAEPGETRELRFKATRQGTYFYHCAAEGMPWEHVSYGMYGVIVVEPPGGLPPVDREIYLAQSEWYLRGNDGAGPRAGAIAPISVLDEDAATASSPDFFTWNGHLEALTSEALYGDSARVNQGQTLRIFFANAGPNLASALHVVGGIFDEVQVGHFADVVRNEETVLLPPGSALAATTTMPVPGKYLLVDHALWRAARGAAGYVHVDAEGDWPQEIHSPVPDPEHAGH